MAILLAGFATFSAKDRREARAASFHIYGVISQLRIQLDYVLNAETGQRGYLLTGLEPYLDPYNEATRSLFGLAGQLRPMLANEPAQLERQAKMQILLAEKMEELAETIALARAGHRDEALKVVNSERGRFLMLEIRIAIAEMIDVEQKRLDDFRQRVLRSEQRIELCMYLCAGVAMAGAIGVFLLLSRDIKRRAADAMILDGLRRDAEAANDAKSDFLATMSHEIRTPMNGIMGLNSLLLTTSLDCQQRQHAEGIQFSAEALLTVVNDILDLSKLDAGRP